MKRWLFYLGFVALIAFLLPLKSYAEGPIVDPVLNPTYTITCTDPIAREDNTPLAINEIAVRNFHVSTDKTTWQPAGDNTTECTQVYDLSAVDDGQYYYTVSISDTDGRQSVLAIDNPENATTGELGYTAIVVKRIAPPRPPSGLTGTSS